MRGATEHQSCDFIPQDISIHAPREGSDALSVGLFSTCIISIHAPREGSDHGDAAAFRDVNISIHAPREGSDLPALTAAESKHYFYPRSP